MKKLHLTMLFCGLLSLPVLLNAGQTHEIIIGGSPGNFTFEPSELYNVEVGDTIVWNNTTIHDHTSSSTDIPGGADSWDYAIGGQEMSEVYVVEVEGTFNYQCNIHPNEHSGFFTTDPGPLSTENIRGLSNPEVLLYPNPAVEKVIIEIDNTVRESSVRIDITSLNGNRVVSGTIEQGNHIQLDLSEVTPGIYIVHGYNEDFTFRKKILVE